MNQSNSLCLAIRSTPSNSNHHLWNNNGTWWCHFTLRDATGRTRRIRLSLKTTDMEKARRKRDQVLAAIQNAAGRLVA